MSVSRHPQILTSQLFGPRPVLIPKMPALGLLLEYPIFEMYNKKIAVANEKLAGPEDPEWRPLIDFEVHRAEIDRFKEEHIYANMRAIEDRDGMYVYLCPP
jgi:tRNA pseudouridine38-40 synthase